MWSPRQSQLPRDPSPIQGFRLGVRVVEATRTGIVNGNGTVTAATTQPASLRSAQNQLIQIETIILWRNFKLKRAGY